MGYPKPLLFEPKPRHLGRLGGRFLSLAKLKPPRPFPVGASVVSPDGFRGENQKVWSTKRGGLVEKVHTTWLQNFQGEWLQVLALKFCVFDGYHSH